MILCYYVIMSLCYDAIMYHVIIVLCYYVCVMLLCITQNKARIIKKVREAEGLSADGLGDKI